MNLKNSLSRQKSKSRDISPLPLPLDNNQAKLNLAEYIRYSKEELISLRLHIEWSSWKWHYVGCFIKQEKIKSRKLKIAPKSDWLDPEFIDFAKAYIRERNSQNPSESIGVNRHRLRALRILELALLETKNSGNPIYIDQDVLNHSLSLIKKHFVGRSIAHTARDMQSIASLLALRKIVPMHIGSWVSPIRNQPSLGISVGSAGDLFRASKLPDLQSLKALAEIFNHNLDPLNPTHQRDIYSTSITALLLAAPSRGGDETHHLPVDLIFKATDIFEKEQVGLRWEAGKGFGSYIKWVWDGMVPIAEIALDRLKQMTAEARNLARWMEDPKTNSYFYRHARCPNVDEYDLLTTKQVCEALGLSYTSAGVLLKKIGLKNRNYQYSLHDLWVNYLIPDRQKNFPNFPYVNAKESAKGKKGGLKLSEALFCMLAKQLHPRNQTSPVRLWMPTLPRYLQDVGLSDKTRTSIFDRHGYRDSDGNPLKLKSHSLRHLLNTEAQRGKMTNEQIAWWSGRVNQAQNQVYNHMTEQERVDRAKDYLSDNKGHLNIVSFSPQKTPHPFSDKPGFTTYGYWRIFTERKIASCDNIELQPQLATINTLYGRCEHDYVLSPCEGFANCLDCSDHACIKGSDSENQEQLIRIKELINLVEIEITQAKTKINEGDWGAQDWHTAQTNWHAKLSSLVDILQSSQTPDGSVIRLAGANSQTHLHRVLRKVALQALESDTVPEDVIQEMLTTLHQYEDDGKAIDSDNLGQLHQHSLNGIEEPKHGSQQAHPPN
jgi:hypothetical protein